MNTTEVSILFNTDIFKVTRILERTKSEPACEAHTVQTLECALHTLTTILLTLPAVTLRLLTGEETRHPVKLLCDAYTISKKAERAMKRVYKGAVRRQKTLYFWTFLIRGVCWIPHGWGEEIYLLCFWWFLACAVPLVSWAGRSEGRWSEGAG